jgi:transketolase
MEVLLNLMMPRTLRNYCNPPPHYGEFIFSGFDPESSFVVPDEVYGFYHKTAAKGAEYENEWNELFKKYAEKYDNEAKELTRLHEKRLPEGWQKCLPVYSPYFGHKQLG